MGLSCRCCKKRGKCVCKACPTIASETLALYKDYQPFDEDGNPYDFREDLAGNPDNPVPFGPLYGPEPPYPENFEIQHTCGYSKLVEDEDGNPYITDLDQGIPPCYRERPPRLDPPVECRNMAVNVAGYTENRCPFGYRCENGFCEPVDSIPKDGYPEECYYEYEQYSCEANGPRMGRVGPSKKSTFFGIGLIPENIDLIECTDPGDGTDPAKCPEGYECVASTDPPEKIQVKPPLPDITPCDDDDAFMLSCPDGYECQCGKCEPEKVDAPIKSYCKLEKTPCSMRVPCPEGYECVTNPDTDESFCEPLSGELTKDFLQHPIQAQFGLFPCKNPHKNEVCAPQDVPEPCDIPDCIPPIGKLPDQCEKCTDAECVDHFGDGYKCNRDGDCEKENVNPCPEGYECRLDPANPIVEDFPSEEELPFGYIGCTDTDCEKEFGPGFKCNGNGDCEIDPEDGTDTNCELLFGEGYEYYPVKPMRDAQGRKYVCDPSDSEAPNCLDLTNDPDSICEDGECHEIVPNCQKVRTNCLPIEIANEPDWVFEEHDGLPVFLVPTDGLPYGPLPLDGQGGTRKRRYDELWKDDPDPDKLAAHIGACNEIDVNNGECTPDCCYETFGDPWLPNHKWICRGRKTAPDLDNPPSCSDTNPCVDEGYACVNGYCEPIDTGEACYLEPIDPYSNKEDELDPLIRDFPEVRELECPDIDQYCGAGAPFERYYLEPQTGLSPFWEEGYIPANCKEVTDLVGVLALVSDDWTPDANYCETLYGLGFDCEEAQPTGITGFDTDADCELATGILGSKCVTLADGTKECYYPTSCIKDHTKCPNGYDCINDQCQVDCEAKYGPGAKCVDLVEPGEKEDRWCQPPCSDDICEEEYGPGFKCNNDGDCEAIRDRDLDSRIPRPIGEEPTYDPKDRNDKLYFGHTSIWGGNNNGKFGVGVFNLDTTKIRTRLYLDYGYHIHYPFDKGHMNTELVPSGCPVQKNPKTDIWKYKGNKGHRVPYPKVNTIAIGNRYPSTHSFIDDEEDFDDFTKIGSGPYFGKYCDRAVGTDEPGGLEGLGDPVRTNWNREANPSKDFDGNTIYAPQHENDDYRAKKDPNGIVKGCNPAFVIPCDTNPKNEMPFEYLNHEKSQEDGLIRTGVCKKDMDDWRVSNQSVFSHNQVPSGPVGGLIIDTVEFVPVKYKFPAHTTSPDMWLWPGLTEYGPSVLNLAVTKNNRVFIPATTLPVYLAVYYNSKIGREPIRYDDKNMDINQFLPPPNGWLENIWQLGDIAHPLNVESVSPGPGVLYSRPAGVSSNLFNWRRGYKYPAMSNQDYIDNYDHLPVDRHWDMPSEETCVDPKQDVEISCADKEVFSRWSMIVNSVGDPIPCIDETDTADEQSEQCVCRGHLPTTEESGDWHPGKQGLFPVDCVPSPPLGPGEFYEGLIWKKPAEVYCTDQECQDKFGDDFKCDGDGNCVGSLCPDGFTCGPPDYSDMIKQIPLDSAAATFEQPCIPGICDQFGEGYECVEGGIVPGSSCNDAPPEGGLSVQCMEELGVLAICVNGECLEPNTCQKPNRMCTAEDACASDPEGGFYLQSCGDNQQPAPPITQSCGPDDLCPPGYRCKNGECEPIPGSDDVKLTKHLFDFWNDGTPFPSNNGDVTDAHLTWFPAEVDQYGEVQLKPSINTKERNINTKYPEKNLFGVEPPDELNPEVYCEDGCPPGYRCDGGSNLCVPGEGSLISQVTYPPLLYTGGTAGGYKTRDGIKNQITTKDRAIKQWWFEQPYHPKTPVESFKGAAGIYAVYLAQIGVPLDYHWYDIDWLSQQFSTEEEILSHSRERPPKPRGDDHSDVREVYRIGGDVSRSSVGLPVGSYHGRDGMIRYNIHPWAQIYDQMRITDSLLEMGRDFHEVQKVLSSIELQCKNGIFNYGTPTIVERFGYDEIGNINFELNQPHGSHLAELTTPRILNYRPTATCPPGTADRIKIGGPGQAMCVTEWQLPFTWGGKTMFQIFMPGGGLYGPGSLGFPFDWGSQPFKSSKTAVVQTYPGYGRGASATKAEEAFTGRAVDTVFGPVEFYSPLNDSGYQLHDGAYIQGKVYGVSSWPYESSNNHITNPNGINGERFPATFYAGGEGYFDPGDLQAQGLQNLNPDMGLFTYCFIAGMNGRDSLPGLPRAWSFGMVGGSMWNQFNHTILNGNANSTNTGDFYYGGTREQLKGLNDALQARKQLGTYASHYFDKYDYPNNFSLEYTYNYIFAATNPGTYRYEGNILGGTHTAPDGTTSPGGIHGNYASTALVKKFMAEDFMEDKFLERYYYAQVVSVRNDGPISTGYDPNTRIVNYFDVKDLEGKHDVHLILKREGQSARLIEGPGASTYWGFPAAPRYYKTAKYQRLDGEDCVDTYDKECAVGGSSPCGDASEEGLVLYTLDGDEECEDCGIHKDNGDFLIDTDDWVCVEGKPVEDDEEAFCGRDADGNPHASQAEADKYCSDMYGKGYTCTGGSGLDQIRCVAPMTCQLQGLLPANMDSTQTGVMDQVLTIPPDRTGGLEHILPMVNLNAYLLTDDDDPTIVKGVKDLSLYYIANQYGSDGSIAPNGQIITDEFLRDLDPFYFYGEPGYTIENPSRVSLRGAVLDSQTLYGYPGYRRVFFSVGHPDIRADFAPQEYICAKMTDPATGLHNSELQRNLNAVSYGAADMNKCIKTSRFYSGERSDYIPLYGQRGWPEPGLHDPPAWAGADSWSGAEDADVLGVTPFHWPWAIGDLCVDWAAGSPRRGGNMGEGVDGRHGFNHENALENVKKYYSETIELYGPPDNQDLERTVTHNEFPNSYAAQLYKLAIISGTTNTGDMQFVSDIHRQKNDILQAKPPCKLWTNIHDFKWPLTPATGVNTPPINQCDQTITPEGESVADKEEGKTEGEPTANTVHGNLNINISEKPIIRFKAGGVENEIKDGVTIIKTGPDKLWFAIDDDGCPEIDVEEKDPPEPCDPSDPDTDCGDGYECRTIEGCDDQRTYCMPKKCTPKTRKKPLKEYREELGFHHLVLQPTTNPLMDSHIRCPLHHVEIPHWGPKVQLKSALFNRDLITINECSECDIDCDCREPDDPEPLPVIDPEQICGRWDGDEECPDGYDCLCHTCQQEPSKKCLKADVYGCRRCAKAESPQIEFMIPVDFSRLLLDPDADKRTTLNIECRTAQNLTTNDGGRGSSCDDDEDCQSRLPTPLYDNFRAANPDVIASDIFCDSDECKFYPPCPYGYECGMSRCEPKRFGDIPPLNGFTDLKALVSPGSIVGSKFIIEEVVFRTTRLRTSDLEPVLSTVQTGQAIDVGEDEWKATWDTTNSFTGKTPNGIFQIEVFVLDSGELECRDIITVRLGELDDGHEKAVTEAQDELVSLGMSTTDAMQAIAQAVEEGQSWNRPTLSQPGPGAGEVEPGEEEEQNSTDALSPEERAENRAYIEAKRLEYVASGKELLKGYPCGKGPDISMAEGANNRSDDLEWVFYVKKDNLGVGGAERIYPVLRQDSSQNQYQDMYGPFTLDDFIVGDSDYPCPDAQYYPEDETFTNIDTGEIYRTISAYQWWYEWYESKVRRSNYSDDYSWRVAIATIAMGMVEKIAERKELSEKLKNGEVSCVENPCPNGYICGEDNICVEPTPPEEDSDTTTE